MSRVTVKSPKLAAALLIAIFASVISGQPPKTVVVGEVVVNGNKRISAAKVLDCLRTKPGKPYSFSDVQDDVGRLAYKRWFKYIRAKTDPMADGRLRVWFEVTEFKTVREVVFRDARHVSERTMREISRVSKGAWLDVNSNKSACAEILAHLKKQGYHFAEVTLAEGKDEDDDRVVFDIYEGPRVRVGGVRFEGQSKGISPELLAAQVDSREATPPWRGPLFDLNTLNADLKKLASYLNDNGFLNAKVEYELGWREYFQTVDIIFRITQGPRYRVLSWDFRCKGNVEAKELAKLIELKKGDIFKQSVISADERRLADWGGRQGKKLEIAARLTLNRENRTVKVLYDVEDAPVDRVGEVVIIGNTVTRDDVIRSQVTLSPGDVLDYTQIPVIEKRLANLGIFDVNPEKGTRPRVTAEWGAPEPRLDRLLTPMVPCDEPRKAPSPKIAETKKNVIVRIDETRTGSLVIGFRLSSSATKALRSGFVVSLEERNFDPHRSPTTWLDIDKGRAFRGGGENLRIEFVASPFWSYFRLERSSLAAPKK